MWDQKKKKREKNCFTFIFCLCLSSASADNPAVWLRAAALREGGSGRESAEGGKRGEDRSSARKGGGEGVVWTPGPRAEQMSVTTCFLTPVRVLVTPRMQPLKNSWPLWFPVCHQRPLPFLPSPSTAAPLPHTRHRCPLCHLHLTSHQTVQTPLTLIKSSLFVQPNITRMSH